MKGAAAPDRGGAEAREGRRIALLLPDLSGGGAERSVLQLGKGLVERGYAVDLVLERLAGDYVSQIPEGLRPILLEPVSFLSGRLAALRADRGGLSVLLRPVLLPVKTSGRVRYIPSLARYLRRERPATLLSGMTYSNLLALWARRLAGADTRIVVTERNTLSARIGDVGRRGRARWSQVPPLVGRVYRWADAIVAVSDGVADDLTAVTGLPRDRITTIHNPVVGPDLFDKAREPAPHPWFDGAHEVMLGAGRLEPAKDFETLLRAFAEARRERDIKLVILGEGSERQKLEALARELGVAADVDLPGWTPNPFAYMARARLFVLSSRFEGLPGALIQALACGCPAVSTDCPSGPREILEGGRLGGLAPVGDAPVLARAIKAALAGPPDRDALRKRGLDFSIERATEEYLKVLMPGGTG